MELSSSYGVYLHEVNRLDEEYLMDAMALEDGQLEHLINAHWSDVWNYVYMMTRNRDTSDDLTQETFIRAFRSLSSFRGQSSYRTWLIRIARNLTLNHRRSAFFRKIVLMGDVVASRETASAEAEFMQRQRVNEIWKYIFQLPVKMREVLILEAKYGMSIKEIAELLSLPEGTVKSRLNRARSQMIQRLKGEL
ncbi:RNA polymerase sigma factor [Cohnella luojiensis]|nr:sigma-70 family RNA polymerase sigma factor [Cohnella luojiensis]